MRSSDEILRILGWAKDNNATMVKAGDVEIQFQPILPPEKPQAPAPKRDARAWVDEQLFGQRLEGSTK